LARKAVEQPKTQSAAVAAPTPEAAAEPTPEPPAEIAAEPEATSVPEPLAPTGDVAGGAEDAELVRRRWPEVLGTLERRRVTWAMVSQSAQVASIDGGIMKLAFDNAALAGRFASGDHAENVALAVRETLGLHVRVEGIAGPGAVTGPMPVLPATTASIPVIKAPPTAKVAQAESASATIEPVSAPEADAELEPDMRDDDAEAPDAQLSGADAIAKMLGGTVVKD